MPITVIPRGAGAGYLVYAAILNQSGTDAPVATVLANTLGDDVTWTRDDAGIYEPTVVASVFTENKTVMLTGTVKVPDFFGTFPLITTLYQDTHSLYMQVFNLASGTPTRSDDQLLDTFIEIRVYP